MPLIIVEAAREAPSELPDGNANTPSVARRMSGRLRNAAEHDMRHRPKRARRSDPGPGTRPVTRSGGAGPSGRTPGSVGRAARKARSARKSAAKSATLSSRGKKFDGVVLSSRARRASYQGRTEESEESEGDMEVDQEDEAGPGTEGQGDPVVAESSGGGGYPCSRAWGQG